MKIAFIGVGKMGLPVCKRLKAAGHEVIVLARRPEQAGALQAAGFKAQDTAAKTIEGSELVFTCVSDDKALSEVLLDGSVLSRIAGASALIDMSTVSPAVSASIAAQLPKSLAFLRSPVSGSTVLAEAGTLTALVSGPKVAFDSLAPIFSCFTKVAFHLGEDEQARYLKLGINSMVAATSALLGEALAFGAKGGLSLEKMMEVITQSVVASPLIAYKKDMIISGDYKPAATLNMLAKDLDLMLAAAQNVQASLPLNQMIRTIYQASVAKGLGEKDFFVLVQEARNSGA